MYMTDEEIYKEWCDSANPKAQIRILADLNSCNAARIKAIIESEKRKAARAETKKLRTGRYLNDAEKAQIWKWHCDGLSIPEMVRRTGRTYDTIKNAINKMKEDNMTFAEELPAEERKQLTEQITALTETMQQPPQELPEGVTAVDIAKALMLMLGEEFDGYRIGIKFSDGWYQVEVHGTEDAAILRRKVDGDEQGD